MGISKSDLQNKTKITSYISSPSSSFTPHKSSGDRGCQLFFVKFPLNKDQSNTSVDCLKFAKTIPNEYNL